MNSSNAAQTTSTAARQWVGLGRSNESSNGRRSKMLRNDPKSGDDAMYSVQVKLTTLTEDDGEDLAGRTLMQIKHWTNGKFGHLVLDTELPGVAGIIGIGYGSFEKDSWEMAKKAVRDGYGVAL